MSSSQEVVYAGAAGGGVTAVALPPPPHPSAMPDLRELRVRLLEMGAATEEIIRDAILALTQQDMALAATVIPRDDAVDLMDVEIEAMCLGLLAGPPAPSGAELRLIGTALKVITDIERIGDHAVDISKVAQRMEREMLYKPLVDIPRLGETARHMLHDALEAFVHHDLERVQKVLAQDQVVDALYSRMRRELQEVMQREPASVMQASYLLFVVHYLERVCDHCCNIAERVAFMETGRMRGVVGDRTAEKQPADVPPVRLTAV
jgi:phosphate transport system protein